MNPKELKTRTKQFANAIVAFCTPLLDDLHTREIARQLLGSGTGVNANYGSAQVGCSNDEFVAKLGQVVDDASEARGWLELLRDSNLVSRSSGLSGLLKEADELTRIFAKSYRTAKSNNLRRKAEKKADSKTKRKATDR